MNIKERQALAERLPWVTRLPDDLLPCDGIKYGTVAVRDLSHWGPRDEKGRGKNPPRGIQPRSRCKRKAHWHYEALIAVWPRYAKTGNYCWDHLICQGVLGEEDRVNRYVNRYLREHA